MTHSNTVTELREQAKAALYKQVRMVIDLAESGSDGYDMEATTLSGMVEMTKALNLLNKNEIRAIIESAKSDSEE